MKPLALFVLLLSMGFATDAEGQSAQKECFASIGAKADFGSAEQVRELQRRVRDTRKNCPQLGFRFHTPERATTIVFDRRANAIVRVALWITDPTLRWEFWSGVTEQGLLRDDSGAGFDAGVYHAGPKTEAMVPASTKRFLAEILGASSLKIRLAQPPRSP